MTRAQLAALIKSKNPVYKDIPDEELVSAVLEKYPVYADQLDTPAPSASDMLLRKVGTEQAVDNSPVQKEPKLPMVRKIAGALGGDPDWWEGAVGGLPTAMAGGPTGGAKLKMMLADAAAPPTSGMDAAKKLVMFGLPTTGDVSAIAPSGNFLQDAAERGTSALRQAGSETTGVKSALTLPIRAAVKLKADLPNSPNMTNLRMRYTPSISGYTGDAGAAAEEMPQSLSSLIDRYSPNTGGASSSGPGAGSVAPEFGPPSGVAPASAPKSIWPPEGGQGEWHSGAEPGSMEAAQAQSLHKGTRELDDLYRSKLSDPLAALLISLGLGGAAASGAQK